MSSTIAWQPSTNEGDGHDLATDHPQGEPPVEAPVDEGPPPPVSGPAALAHAALGQHLVNRPQHVALRFVDDEGHSRSLSYSRLADQARRFAGALDVMGVLPGEWVVTLLPRRWELHAALLGTLWHGSVFTALCSTRGPSAAMRSAPLGSARLMLTTVELAEEHAPILRASGTAVMVVGPAGPGDPGTRLSDMMALPHWGRAVPTHSATGATAIVRGNTRARVDHDSPALVGGLGDLTPDDVVWFAAGTGWRCADPCVDLPALVAGATAIVDEGEPDADRWHRIIEAERVSVWCLTPEDVRWLRWTAHTSESDHRLGSLRSLVILGEPSPALVEWAGQAYGAPVTVLADRGPAGRE